MFGNGGGIPYSDFDSDFLEGQAEMNRVQFINFLGSEWIPQLSDVHERLLAKPDFPSIALCSNSPRTSGFPTPTISSG